MTVKADLSMVSHMQAEKKTILVTGGAGFIGTHLCRRLMETGNYVISLDNYFTGSRENKINGVEYIDGHTKNIGEKIQQPIDLIYHLGEYARVGRSIEEPEVVFDLNMVGTFSVLEFWRERGCKLVYAGSSTKSVGERNDGVLGKDLSPYTWSKSANSDLVRNYGRWYGLPYAIVYFYNVYGPGERGDEGYGTVIERFRQKYIRHEPLEVRMPGTQRRIFTHIEDTIDGIILAGMNGLGDGYGISSNDDFSLLEVAHLFGGSVKMLPTTVTTRENSVANAEKIQALGWIQQKTLRQYIEEIKKSTQ